MSNTEPAWFVITDSNGVMCRCLWNAERKVWQVSFYDQSNTQEPITTHMDGAEVIAEALVAFMMKGKRDCAFSNVEEDTSQSLVRFKGDPDQFQIVGAFPAVIIGTVSTFWSRWCGTHAYYHRWRLWWTEIPEYPDNHEIRAHYLGHRHSLMDALTLAIHEASTGALPLTEEEKAIVEGRRDDDE